MKNNHSIKKLLLTLGISTKESIQPYFPHTRDRKDVSVLRCIKSGVILLSSSDHIQVSHYNKKEFNGRGAHNRKAALMATAEDTNRRAEQFKSFIKNKKWIDVGSGAGGILDALSPVAKEIVAVEPQDKSRNSLLKLRYNAYPLLVDVQEKDLDVATFFHVLEHLPNPLDDLKVVRSKLKKKGKIIIEVPHARDFLITFLENEAFKAHTFWSEHLILHTKESLRILLRAAGFSHIVIEGFQRYPLANHLHWLSKGKPGGQNIWPQLRSQDLDKAYERMLQKLEATDTLIAIAEK